MKLKTGNPRVRGPRKSDRKQKARPRVEPSTFAWIEPLADVNPVIVDREVVVETKVEKQVFVDRPYEVTKEVVVEKEVLVDRPVPVTEKVFVDREIIVEKEVPVYIDREVIVEHEVTKEVAAKKSPAKKPLVVEKQVFIDREVEKKVFVDRPVEVAAVAAVAGNAVKKSKNKSEPKAIIIGRGPSLAARIARIAPKPGPVLAGAAALLIALVGVALISPSGDNATANRSSAAFVGDSTTDAASTTKATKLQVSNSSKQPLGKTRDPFAAKGYVAPKAKKTAAQVKTEAAANAKVVAGAPAAATQSLYTANLIAYSSFTPWTKTRKNAGGWINLGGKPTVKVISVGKKSVELFVVTDVEVIENKSKNFKYDDPIRQVHLDTDGVVRFSDYRDIQGDDVTYTIRYNGSDLIKAAKSAKK